MHRCNTTRCPQRRRARRRRRDGDRTLTTEPNIAYVYEPRGAARELFACRAPEVSLEGPAGTGKTRAVLQKIHAIQEKYPGARGLILREYRIALNETVLVTYESKVLPKGHAALDGRKRNGRQSYTYANGSEIVLGGMDAPERFMSGEYDWAYLAEGTDIKDEGKWEMVLTRLRNGKVPYQQGFVDANPGAPSHWLNVRPDRKRSDGRPVMVRMLSRHADNPSITPEYLDNLSNLTGVRRQRLFEGKWVAAEGLIYDFSRERHVRETDTSGWHRIICGCDDGNRNPFAFLRGLVGPDGQLHIEEEHHASGMVPETKVRVARRMAVGAESIEIDPAAGIKLAFKDAGLPLHDGDNEVLAGIARVADRFASDRITISPACVKLIQELEGYEWEDNDKKDQPIKEQDHGVDALRYLVARLDRTGGAYVAHVGYDAKTGEQVPTLAGKQESPKTLSELRQDPEWGWQDV